jgi:hypothetical protein
MKKYERENIIRAYNNLVTAKRRICDYELLPRGGVALTVSDDDYCILKPFLNASFEDIHVIGEVKTRTTGMIHSFFYEVTTSDGSRDLVFVDQRNQFDFFTHLRTMVEDVTGPLFQRTKSEYLYIEEDD